MVAKLVAKYGRKLVMWAVIAGTTALARKAMERWASRDEPIETAGGASS